MATEATLYPDSAGNPSEFALYEGAPSDRDMELLFEQWKKESDE